MVHPTHDKTEAFNDLLQALVELAPNKKLRDILQGFQKQIEADMDPSPMDLNFPRELDVEWNETPHLDVFLLTSRYAAVNETPGDEQLVPMMFDTILSDVEVERLVRYMRGEQKTNPDSVRVEFAGHARVRLVYPEQDVHCTVTHRVADQLAGDPPKCEQPDCDYDHQDGDAARTPEEADKGS